MIDSLLPLVQKLRGITLVRYGFASIGALAVDMASFLALLQAGLAAMLASAIAYSLGIVAHWVLSSRKVFADSVVASGSGRTRQKALFVVSALIGLAVTTAIVGGATLLGSHPMLAKLAAIAVSFTITWLLRNHLVFRT